MVTIRNGMHSWQLVGAPADGAVGLDAVDAALSRAQATFWYGTHCFEFTSSADENGDCLLRLEEVGRRAEEDDPVMVFVEHGYQAEQHVALCRTPLAGVDMREIDAKMLRAQGRGLLVDAARAVDLEDVT